MPNDDHGLEARLGAALEVSPMPPGMGDRLKARLLVQVGPSRRPRAAGVPWPWLCAFALAAVWAGVALAGGTYVEIAAPVAATIVASLFTAAAVVLAAALHTLALPIAALSLALDLVLVATSRRMREVGL